MDNLSIDELVAEVKCRNDKFEAHIDEQYLKKMTSLANS